MKEKLLTLLNNAPNVETRKQYLIAYLTLIDSVEQQAEDLATVISGLFTATEVYKDMISDLVKNQKETNSEEPYDGMTRRGDDGSWERYSASDGEWYVPADEYYVESADKWLPLEEMEFDEEYE